MTTGIERWISDHIVKPTHMKDSGNFPKWWSPSGWRVFAINMLSYKRVETPPGVQTKEWKILRLWGPGLGTSIWENGLLHFSFHLPFCVALHLRLPFGLALQAQLGWKTTGNLAATLRVRGDYVQDYNDGVWHWRTRGLEEGPV